MAVIPNNALSKIGRLTEVDLKAVETQISETSAAGNWHALEKGEIAAVVVAKFSPILNGAPPMNHPGETVKSDAQLRQEMTNNVTFAAHAPGYISRLIGEIRWLQQHLAATAAAATKAPPAKLAPKQANPQAGPPATNPGQSGNP